MVTVNAGGVSETVFESELFGHVRGAFTDARADRVGRFELADGGTLFLDEIANVPLSQQAKLLRVIAAGEFERLGSSRTRRVDVRIMSATNADIDAEVAAGRFRQDLLFRLNTIEIVTAAAARSPRRHPVARHALSRAACAALSKESDRIRRRRDGRAAAASVAGQRARARACHRAGRADGAWSGSGAGRSRLAPHRRTVPQSLEDMGLEDVEAFLIRKAVAGYGSVTEAAKALGLSRSALYRRLERYGIEP